MTLTEFIAAVQAGTLLVAGGQMVDGMLVEHAANLAAGDLDAVTAEAYNVGIFGAVTKWAAARIQIEQALAGVRGVT